MAIEKRPAPKFLKYPPEQKQQESSKDPNRVKKPRGLFHKREDITQEDPKQQEKIKSKNEELRKKAMDSVYETSHEEEVECYDDIGCVYYDTETVIDHKLTDFGKQYVFENDELYWQLPEHFRTDSMRAEIATYRPDLLRVEGFDKMSDKQLLLAIAGPIPEGLSNERVAEIRQTRAELLREGVLNEISDPEISFEIGKPFDQIIECCTMPDVDPEFIKWAQYYDERNHNYLLCQIDSEIESLFQGDVNVQDYEKACKGFKAVYPDEDFKELEKELWLKHLERAKMVPLFALEKLKEFGINATDLTAAKDLQKVCNRIKNFVIENNLGVRYHQPRHRIENIDQHSMSIYNGEIATITLASKNIKLSFDMALGENIGFSEGHVHNIANLSDKQFNKWITDVLERATRGDCVYIVDKELAMEDYPQLCPAKEIEERLNENPHCLTIAQRKTLEDAYRLQDEIAEFHKNPVKDFEKIKECEERDDRTRD